jgi:transposase InsO family protein
MMRGSQTRSTTCMSRRVAHMARPVSRASSATEVGATPVSGSRGSWPSAASSVPTAVAAGGEAGRTPRRHPICSDQRWVADITEFGRRDGKLFLAGIKDLHDQGLAGWSMGERQTTDLVVNALVMALARRAPDGDLIHHADRGSQYRSLEFSNRLADWHVNASYGSTGDCWDNAAMETSWAAIKRDMPTSGARGSSSRVRSSARSCSSTSRSSTTVNDTKPAPVTAPRPRPTLPPRRPDSHQPVSKIAGQLHCLRQLVVGPDAPSRYDYGLS